METNKVIDTGSNGKEQILIIAHSAEETPSVRSWPSSVYKATDISDDKSEKKPTNRHIPIKKNIVIGKHKVLIAELEKRGESRKSVNKSRLGTIPKIIDIVSYLFKKALDYLT